MSESTIPIAIAALVFLAVALAIDAFVNWWREERAPEIRRVRERITRMSQSETAEPLEVTPDLVRARALSGIEALNPLLERVPGLDALERVLAQSNLKWTVGRFLFVSSVPPLVALILLSALTGKLGLGLFVATVLALVPWFVLRRLQERRLKRFTLLLPEALDSLSRAMRAGHSMSGGLKVVGDEMPEPVGPEFAQAHDEITYGIAPQIALNNLLERIPSEDLKFMVVAILIQRETGGNLGEVLGNIARLMRERQKLQGQVQTLSADGRMSAIVLCLLPVVTVAIMFVANRSFIEVLWLTRPGQLMMLVAAGLMLAGIVWVRRVVQIRF